MKMASPGSCPYYFSINWHKVEGVQRFPTQVQVRMRWVNIVLKCASFPPEALFTKVDNCSLSSVCKGETLQLRQALPILEGPGCSVTLCSQHLGSLASSALAPVTCRQATQQAVGHMHKVLL